jgi:hypothetical protein
LLPYCCRFILGGRISYFIRTSLLSCQPLYYADNKKLTNLLH